MAQLKPVTLLKYFVPFMLAAGIFTSCDVTRAWRNRLKQEWVGKTKEELLAKRGKPYQISSVDIKGTNIYIYHTTDFTPDIPPNNYYEEYFINDKNIIYKIETYAD